MSWFDSLQARDCTGHTFADSIHTRQVIDLIIGCSSEHGGCWLAIRYGLGRAVAGHVSVVKLSKATQLPLARCREILDDMRTIITRSQ